MKKTIEAVVVLCKCPRRHEMYGIRTEKREDGAWNMTWAFPIKESVGKSEGFDKTSISGSVIMSDEYPGCPYCKQRSLTVCSCGRLNCTVIQNNMFTCDWCGMRGEIGAYHGEAISAGGDY